MSGTDAANGLYIILLLVLVGSSLLARRIPIARAAKMALAWLAIFTAAMLILSQRHRIGGLWASLTSGFGDGTQQVAGGSVRIAMADDGHFWADATINGVPRRMLIDSGATTTAISSATAAAARLDLGQSPFATVLSTANGDVGVTRSSIASLRVGSIAARDLDVVVSPAFGDTDVLGMNFLSQLKGWRVEGRTLILEAPTNVRTKLT